MFKRILLKLSGESLFRGGNNIDPNALQEYTNEIIKVYELGVQIAIVIGGGNIYRGTSGSDFIDRVQGDYMGMLATLINALALQSSIEHKGIETRLQSSIGIDKIAEPFIRRRAIRHLDKSRIVIFGGGTGNPYFSTDTTATLRAIEIKADVIIKATKVDGIYNEDPKKNSKAFKFNQISYEDAYNKKLRVMDMTAFTLGKENNIPIIVFDISKKDNFKKIIKGEKIGTIVN